MPVIVEEMATDVDDEPEDTTTELSQEDLRVLAELIYRLLKEELRIERERLGR